MKEIIKKYLVHFILGVLMAGVAWVVTINSRTFDSTEQKVTVISTVLDGPTVEQKWRTYILDSIDKISAVNTRTARLQLQKKSDSTRTVHDSLFIDMVKRQTVQIEKINAKLDKIESHH